MKPTKIYSLYILLFLVFGYNTQAATIYFNEIYKGTGTSYGASTQSIDGIQLIVGYSFKVVSADPNAISFPSGNDIPVTLYYLNASGVEISIIGMITRQKKNGSVIEGFYFVPVNSYSPLTYTGESYLLVIPGKESVFQNGNNYGTASNGIDTALNAVLTSQTSSPIISINDLSVLENAGYAVFTLSLTNTPTSNYTLNPYLTAVSAVSGVDYTNSMEYSTNGGTSWTSFSGTLTITSTALTFQIRVPIINYNTSLTNKTFLLTTGSITGGGILNNYGAYGEGTILVPVITTVGSLGTFSACPGFNSPEQSFSVSGINLVGNLIVTPPTGYEVSIVSGSGFLPSVSLPPTSNTVSSTTIYVRLTTSATLNASGNIACTSTSAVTKNVATGSATVSPTSGTISGVPSTSFCSGSNNNTTLTLSGYSGGIQWASSLDNSTFTTISGATAATYTASGLTTTTYFKAFITDYSSGNCGTTTTTPVTITVDPASVAGTITKTFTNCTATSATLTLSGYTGSIQWQSSTDNSTFSAISGANSPTYETPEIVTTTYYRVLVTSGVCSAVTSALNSQISPTATNNVWSGAVNTDWNNSGNWSLGTPDTWGSIEIQAASRYPKLNAATTVKNLTIATGATLELNGSALTVSGAFSGTGTIIGSATSDLIINCSGNAGTFYMDQTTNHTSNLLRNLTLNKSLKAESATIGNALDVKGILTLTTGTLLTNGLLTLKSDATTTAVVAPILIDNAVAITGEVTVEQFFPANRAFRFVSSPITTTTFIRDNWQEGVNNDVRAYSENKNPNPGYGTHITGNNAGTYGFDITETTNPSMFTYDNTSQKWASIGNTNATTLTAGVPYRLMIRGNRSIDMNTNTPPPSNTTLRTKGTLQIYDSAPPISLSTIATGYSFIGNPYQAVVDIKSVLTQGSNVNTNFYYTWDPNINTRGAYVAYDLSINSNPVSGSGVTQYLQPWQACFIANTSSGGSITFKEAHKSTSSTNKAIYRTATGAASYMKLNLYESSVLSSKGTATDGLIVKFGQDYTNQVDYTDAEKFSHLDETFATVNNTTPLAIESRAEAIPTDVIPLKITKYRNINYTIVAEGINLNGIPAYLHDQYAQVYTEIPQSGAVNYAYFLDPTIAATSASDRFRIVFQNPNLGLEDHSAFQFTIYPNPSNGGNFSIVLPDFYEDTKVIVYNTIGQQLYTTNFIEHSPRKMNVNKTLATGIYYVKVTQNGKTAVNKLIVE